MAGLTEVLGGLVDRVTFHNTENGFCVLRVKARGQRDLITVQKMHTERELTWPPFDWILRVATAALCLSIEMELLPAAIIMMRRRSTRLVAGQYVRTEAATSTR